MASSKKSEDKIGKVMHEFKEGTLKSGSGAKVTDRKQAIAIGLSEEEKTESKGSKKKNKS